MTYRELLGYAQKKIDNNEITVGEYMEMTKVLNHEVDVLNKIRAELMLIEGMEDAIEIIDKYREGEQE